MVFIPVQDDNPLRHIRFQWVTIAIIILNIIVFFAESTDTGQKVVASFSIIPAELLKVGIFGGAAYGPLDAIPVPERYTLFTYMFLHGDILHLASNMAFLWVFGDNVEDALGHVRFALFYVICGMLAALVHALMLPASTLPLIGASGAVAGVIGAYLLLHPMVKVWILALRFIPLRLPAFVVLGAWVAAQIAMILTGTAGETAWWAHLGGFVVGMALVIVLRRPGVPLLRREIPAQGAAGGTREIPPPPASRD